MNVVPRTRVMFPSEKVHRTIQITTMSRSKVNSDPRKKKITAHDKKKTRRTDHERGKWGGGGEQVVVEPKKNSRQVALQKPQLGGPSS